MENMTIFFYGEYYEEFNNAMRYIVNNLNGVTVLQCTETMARLEVTEEARKVIHALWIADCFSYEKEGK